MEGMNIEKKITPFIPMYFEVNFLNEKCTKEFYKTSKFTDIVLTTISRWNNELPQGQILCIQECFQKCFMTTNGTSA